MRGQSSAILEAAVLDVRRNRVRQPEIGGLSFRAGKRGGPYCHDDNINLDRDNIQYYRHK